VIPNTLGFFAFPLYAKALGASSYGIVALLEAYQAVLVTLLFMGMTTAFFVFYTHAHDKEDQHKVFGVSAFFGGLILVPLGIISLFASPISKFLLNDEAPSYFVSIYAFSVFSDYLMTIVNTYFRIKDKIHYLLFNGVLISVVHHTLNFCFVVLWGGSIETFITLFLVVKSVSVGIAVFEMWRFNLLFIPSWVDFSLFRKMIRFGAPLILTGLTGWMLLVSDRFFINYYVALADVGIYAVNYKFAMGLWIGIVQPFMTVWEPGFFKTLKENVSNGYDQLKRDFTLYLGGIVTIYSAFILFIGDILKVIFGNSEYDNQNFLIYLLAASYFFMAIGEMWASVCRHHKTSNFAFWVTLSVVIIKVGLNFILIPRYLLVGAALSSVIAEIVSQTIMAYFAVRLTSPRKLFFTLPNWILFSLFCLTQGLLYAYPAMSLMVKTSYFSLILLIVGGVLAKEKKEKAYPSTAIA
jgi:O-antigen/teichoic acid export membrane protein